MCKHLCGSLVIIFVFAFLLFPSQTFALPTTGPDLTIAKSHTGNFTVGTNGTYTILVSNVGTDPTSGTITVTDTLPAGLLFISGIGNGWSCSASGQAVTCTNAGPIANGGNSTITLTVGVTGAAAAASPVTNTATVSNGSDVNTVNNSASNPTTVNSTPKSGPTVYISSFDGRQILAVDGATGTTVGILTESAPFEPEDIIVGPDARIYICDSLNSKVWRVKQNGMEAEVIYDHANNTSGPTGPEGPAFKGNNLFFNTRATDTALHNGVWEIPGIATIPFGGSPPGTFPAPTRIFTAGQTGSAFGEGLAFDSSGRMLIVDSSGSNILRSDASLGTLTTLIMNTCVVDDSTTPCLSIPVGIALNSAGHIFVANVGSVQNINEFLADGRFSRTYATFPVGDGSFFLPIYMEFDAFDRLYVATAVDGLANEGKVWRVEPGTTPTAVLIADLDSLVTTNGILTGKAVGVGLGLNTFLTQHYSVSGTPLKKQFAFSTTGDEVDITFPAILTAFDLTVFREEIPEALLGLQLPTSSPSLHFPCAEYNSDRGTCVVYEEGVGSKLNPLPTADFTGPVDYQLFYTPNPLVPTGVPVLAHARDDMLQTPVDQYDENELTGFTLATSVVSVGDPTGMDGGSGGLSRHVALNTPQTQTGTLFCGFQSPVPGQTFGKPQAVPVRFKIAASGGNCQMGPYITNAVSQLWLFNTTTQKFVTPTSKSNTGNFFFANTTTGQNNYNIDTKNLTPGTYIFTMTSDSVSAQFSNFVLVP